VVPNLFEHFSDLPIASLIKGYFKPGILGFFYYADFCPGGAYALVGIALFGNRYPRSQAPELIFRRLSRNFHQICLGNMRGRLHQLVRKSAVVGEQQQSLTVEVETTDRVEAGLAANQVHHRGPAFGI
jgi:hypothetical protein